MRLSLSQICYFPSILKIVRTLLIFFLLIFFLHNRDTEEIIGNEPFKGDWLLLHRIICTIKNRGFTIRSARIEFFFWRSATVHHNSLDNFQGNKGSTMTRYRTNSRRTRCLEQLARTSAEYRCQPRSRRLMQLIDQSNLSI